MAAYAAESGLNLTVVSHDECFIVRVEGEAGIDQVNVLVRGLQAVGAHRPSKVVLEASRLRFASSLALGIIVQFAMGVIRRGGKVYLADPQPVVEETVRRVGLEAILEITSSAEEAAILAAVAA